MKLPILESEHPWQVWYESTNREIRGKGLCDVGGESKIGFGILELPPGSDTRPSHYHTHEEEHLFVLSGSSTLCLGPKKFELEPGSYVCFPAGQEHPHHLVNNSDDVLRYVMVGERLDADEVMYELDV
jgi:uncharacterized cupin superfamily protein